MGAVVMVLRGRFRQYWKSWLALGLLVAVAGGFVLTTASAGHRTADAFPGYVARHGYDVIVYSPKKLPRLSRLPHVTSVTPTVVTYNGAVGCASCHTPIDTRNFLVNEVPPGQLPRMTTLLSGRMPRQSDPGEVLASFTLARDNGVRVGSVLRPQLGTQAELEGAKVKPSPALRPALRVVGIVVTESEFPAGASPHYDLFATTAYTAAFNPRVALLWTYYVRLVNFGESVNFPLLFAAALSVFGAATLLHLLLVSVARRQVEAGLLKALGFVRRQVAAAVCWQATTVALVGIAVGVPVGVAAGKVLWRVFATNFGVVPVTVAEPVLIAGLAAGVLAAANLLAAVPALLAARSQPARLLRAE